MSVPKGGITKGQNESFVYNEYLHYHIVVILFHGYIPMSKLNKLYILYIYIQFIVSYLHKVTNKIHTNRDTTLTCTKNDYNKNFENTKS